MSTKYCPRCQTTKGLDEFGPNRAKPDGRQGLCKPCSKDYRLEHYQGNKKPYIARAARTREQLKDEVRKLKEETPCADCGEKYPYYVMDFDHLHGKVANINALVARVGRAKVMEEIAKCELVCSNCHRIRTHERARG